MVISICNHPRIHVLQNRPESFLRAAFLFALFFSFYQTDDQQNYSSKQSKDSKQEQESNDAKGNIIELQCTRMCDMLSNLNRKGNDQDNSKNIKPRNHNLMSLTNQQLENRVNKEEQQHSCRTDYQKMQLLIGQNRWKMIIQTKNIIMNLCD